MRRSVTLVSLALVSLVMMAQTAHAQLPGEAPANTYQVNGPRVRSVVVVGDNVWIAGIFSQVQTGTGANAGSVENLAVLSRTTGQVPAGVTPLKLGGVSGAQVWKLAAAGNTVYAAGKFKLSSGGDTYTNLLAFNGTTGALIPGFHPTGVKASQAVAVGGGRVYAGGKQLVAYDASTGAKLGNFQTSSVSIDPSLRGHNTAAQHRDLQLIDGSLYSACQCDSVTQGGSTRQTKALVRFDPVTGEHDQSFTPQGAGTAAFGIAVTTDGTNIYLGAGGSDFVAKYAPSGNQFWKRDTSGSTQAVAVSGDDLIIGGHFLEIGDQAGDQCGFKSSNPGTLDPNDECASRERMAAYSLDGALRSWNPSVTGKYNGVWAIALESGNVHIGGEFKKVHGVAQTFYARLDAGGSASSQDPGVATLAELASPQPLPVQPNREVSFTLRCPDPANECVGTVQVNAAGSKQAGPTAITIAPQGEANYVFVLNDAAWNKITSKANGKIGASIKLTATDGSGTALSETIKVQLALV
ncbi:MAG TPA: hypothetical protein VFM38_02190 [Candidatus Limnocylindrales bacterium]|nr:hypothetical protein [Candidatus Limnocylindrales bacterium]